MKMKISLLLITVFTFSAIHAQQNCSRFYPTTEGTVLEYTNYDKKGKTDGTVTYTVHAVTDNADNTRTEMGISFTDKKGDNIYNTDYAFVCSGNTVSVDYETLVPKQMVEQYADMEMEITGTDIEFPNELSVGQELKDANMAMKISMGGININTTVDMVSRKVEKQETLSTSAGTFDCFVVYSENRTKVMMVNKTYPSRVWLAEGVGMVKQESYKANGNLINRTELTKFSK